jgi:AcrR family transcriptional regulator
MARGPSARAHNQVLDAAIELFSGRGIDNTTMDAISEASGVSKATIYKHWSDKDQLALDVLARLSSDLPQFDSGDVKEDIVQLLDHRAPESRCELQNRMVPHFMAHAARNPEFGAAWRARIMEPPRSRLLRLLKRAVAEGRLGKNLDPDLAVAQLLGPMMYRHVLQLSKAKLPEDMAKRIVDSFWKAHGAEFSPVKKRREAGPSTAPPLRTRTNTKRSGM